MIEVRNIKKSYRTGNFTQTALDDVSISLRDNEFVAVLGPSGSGKTTLLNILGGLDTPDSGEILIGGTSTKNYSSKDWDTYRNHRIGFIFQSYNLIPHQSVASNVELALTLAGVSRAERHERALAALDRVGLSEHAHKRPNQLSGGQMQRVAIARALVNDPSIVLADEPTGALDTETGVSVMNLLQEIASDRLVVMVTHNPDLAEAYATRIISLKDGKITSDTNPIGPQDTLPPTRAKREALRRASMSFFTALSLSFSNLMTKKGRTFMTAFASSIGIMGIAAILALSNGINDYIARTEYEAMSSYPLQVTKSAADFTSLLETDDAIELPKSDPKPDDVIPERLMLADMFSSVSTNDLKHFKEFIESEESDVSEHVSTVSYDYGIDPHFFAADTSDGVTELGIESILGTSRSTSQQASSTAMSNFGMSFGSSGVFQQMIDNMDLINEQYEVIMGHLPEAMDECVLVLGRDGTLSDYTLFGIGTLDPESLRDALRKLAGQGKDGKMELDSAHPITYGQAMELSFKVVPSCRLYRRNDESGTWTSVADNKEAYKEVVDQGVNLHVVGIIHARPDTSGGSLTQGIAYTSELTRYLIEEADSSEIVKGQLADPQRDVFTGKTFDELLEQKNEDFDLSSIFQVDTDAMSRAINVNTSSLASLFDTSALSAMTDSTAISALVAALDPATISSQLDPSTFSLTQNEVNEVLDALNVSEVLSHMPEPNFSKIDFEGMGVVVTAQQLGTARTLMRELADGFLPWYFAQHPDADLSEDVNLTPEISAYLATPEALAVVAQVNSTLFPEGTGEQMTIAEAFMRDYLENEFAPWATNEMGALIEPAVQMFSAIVQERIAAAVESLVSGVDGQFERAIAEAVAGQAAGLSSLTNMQKDAEQVLSSLITFDNDAFAQAFNISMTQADLSALFSAISNAGDLSYESNLVKLGYANIDDPSSISFYPKSFDDKEALAQIIADYNKRMEEEGLEDRKIVYADLVGVLLSSVTSIVDSVSVALIAFVSVSLVVSSIMISIITYISVLERKKEIGILRAMGASKLNIANVFNAETIIEGLLAGLLAVGTVAAVSIPINVVVYESLDVANIMQLSTTNAAALVAISTSLTFIAGLIPSSAAARRDPVEALRSE